MPNQTNILFLTANTTFSKLLSFSLETNFNFKITQYAESSPIESILDSRNNYFLMVCDGSVPKKEVSSCLEKAKRVGLQIPIMVLGTQSYLEDFKTEGAILIDRENALVGVEDSVKKLFVENPMIKPLEYCPVQFRLLTAFDSLQCDVYIKMPTGRYLKIFKQEDLIVDEDVVKYERKGVEALYLKKKTAFWILKEVRNNYSNVYNAFEKGDKAKIKSPPKDIDTSPGESENEEDPNSLASAIADLKGHAEEKSQEKIEKQLDGTFKISKEFKKDVDKKVKKAVKIMSKSAKVKGLLKKLKVNRNPDQYCKIHVNLLVKLTAAFANLLEWNTETTLEKLIFVSYMHDITLVDHPHLARIQDLKEFEAIKSTLTKEEIELFLNHPEDIRKMVENMDEHPVEADKIIYQHHEHSDGSGFPNKLSTSRILPLSALFIMAHDLTNYIIDHPDWNLEAYTARCKEKYVGANFTKIIRKLGELKT